MFSVQTSEQYKYIPIVHTAAYICILNLYLHILYYSLVAHLNLMRQSFEYQYKAIRTKWVINK
jgi:hypothetical protein